MVRWAGPALILGAAALVAWLLTSSGDAESPGASRPGTPPAAPTAAPPELAGTDGARRRDPGTRAGVAGGVAPPPAGVRLRPAPLHERKPVPLRLSLVDAAGRALRDVTVRVYRRGRRVLEARTDGEGRLTANLPAGRYEVHALDGARANTWLPDVILDGGAGEGLELALGTGPALHVQFTRERSPLVSVPVHLIPAGRPSATLSERLLRTLATVETDATGTASFPSVVPGAYDVIAQVAPVVFARVRHTHEGEDVRRVAIGRDVELTGRVTDGWEGPPVPGVALSIGGSIGPVAIVARPLSDIEGRFTLLVPSAGYDSVLADAEGWLAWPPQRFADATERRRALGNLPRLAQGRPAHIHIPLTRLDGPPLVGRVVDPTGAPVPDVGVVVAWDEYGATALEETVTARPYGAFAFATLRPGNYRVWVEALGWHSRPPVAVRIPPDTRTSIEVVVPVTPAARLAGRVLLPGGAPAAAARVWLASALPGGQRAPADPSAVETFTDGAGIWALGGLTPGSVFVVRAARGDLQSAPRTVTVGRDGAENLSLPLAAAPGLTLLVLEEGSRKPVSRAEVRVEPVGEPLGRVTSTYRTDPAGRVEIPSMLRAKWRLTPASEWHRPAPATLLDLTAEKGSPTVELTLDPGLAIAGRVLDGAESPVAATVHITGRGEGEPTGRQRSVSTDEQGFFRATGLAWGAYTLTVSVSGRAPIVRGDLHGGEENLAITVGE